MYLHNTGQSCGIYFFIRLLSGEQQMPPPPYCVQMDEGHKIIDKILLCTVFNIISITQRFVRPGWTLAYVTLYEHAAIL